MDRMNQWLTLIANLGVLVGIGFLAYEVRQNTDAIHSQTRATMYSGAQEELWKNMEYPDVTLNMPATGSELTAEEKIRLAAFHSEFAALVDALVVDQPEFDQVEKIMIVATHEGLG